MLCGDFHCFFFSEGEKKWLVLKTMVSCGVIFGFCEGWQGGFFLGFRFVGEGL